MNTRPLKTGIDARLYGTKYAGIGRYTEELIKNLQKIDSSNKYVIFCRRDGFDRIATKANWSKVVADIPVYSIKEQTLLPTIFKKENLDILHVPHFNVSIFYNRPFIVTIHDLLWYKHPELSGTNLHPFIHSIKQKVYSYVTNYVIKNSLKIITPSQAVKDEILEEFRVSPLKIEITYEGATKMEGRRWKVEDGDKYLLYVGALYPHKNVETLIKAVKSLNYQLKAISYKLFIVTQENKFLDRFKKFLEEENMESSVEILTNVNDKELFAFYKNAKVFVSPTLYEGFGLSGLEAMSNGCPVVCSNLPVLKEIYGEAALYFNPKDHQDIVQKLQKVLTSSTTRLNFVRRGQEQVKKYSWEKMARQTLRIYKEAALMLM